MRGKPEDGIFTPVVQGAKVLMGEENLKSIRAKAIKAHGEVMTNLIDTHDTPVGDYTLKKLFEVADADSNGTIDIDEMKAALHKLGFSWLDDGKTQKIVKKGDMNGDNVIDFEEFKRMAPTVLRQNLMKLAKANGGQLGFLS